MSNIPYKLHPLIHAAEMVQEKLGEQLEPIGIKPRQARILNVLHLMGTASQADLAREFNVSAASMSTMTARLISGGFISRTVDADEPRRNQLRLTEKGTSLIEPINAAWREIDKMMEQVIGEDHAENLARLSGELRTRLGGRVAGASTGYRFYGENGAVEFSEATTEELDATA